MSDIKIVRLAALVMAALLILLGGCTGPNAEVSEPAQTGGAQSASPSCGEATPSGELEPDASAPVSSTEEPTVSPEPTPTPTPEPKDTPSPAPSPSVSSGEGPTTSVDKVFVVSGAVGEGEAVEESWFSDAVFVGDSRTDGLRLYSGIKSADFICHQGLSVFTIGSKECIKLNNGEKVTALEALGQKQYAKVYLMLGVNELGYRTEAFRSTYTELVQEIKELQPNAVIYLQTLPPVNEPLARSKGISSAITNKKLIAFNQVIAEIAESEETALVTVDELFWTEQDELAKENTTDGVHLTRKGYEAWFGYLRTHTGTTDSVEVDPEASPAAQPADSTDDPPLSDRDVSAQPEPSDPAQPGPAPSEGEEQVAVTMGVSEQG